MLKLLLYTALTNTSKISSLVGKTDNIFETCIKQCMHDEQNVSRIDERLAIARKHFFLPHITPSRSTNITYRTQNYSCRVV